MPTNAMDFPSKETRLTLYAACKNRSLMGMRRTKELVADTKLRRRNKSPLLPLIDFVSLNSLPDAIQSAASAPESCIVLACGFTGPEIHQSLKAYGDPQSISVIAQVPAPGRLHTPSASLFDTRRITRVKSLSEGLRKAVLQASVRSLGGQLRIITQSSEYEQFFRLRHAVWKEMGYLSPEQEQIADSWEIDYFDRSSTPLGFFMPDGKLYGCARLVHAFGHEHAENLATINQLIKLHGNARVARAFSYPGKAQQPFDILCEFRGFRDYFRSLVRSRVSMAEVSRIIIHPRMRGLGLAEVMVDSVVSLAITQGVNELMLACREGIAPLYRRCGFVPVSGLVSDQFITIPERSIVMERKLKKS